MRDITIDLICANLQIFVIALGGFLGWYLGGNDGLLITLVIFQELNAPYEMVG